MAALSATAVVVSASASTAILGEGKSASEKVRMSDDPKETAAAEAAFTVAPSVASTFTSGEGGVASVSVLAADATVVAVASSSARRRMHEIGRKIYARQWEGQPRSERDPCQLPCQRRPWRP